MSDWTWLIGFGALFLSGLGMLAGTFRILSDRQTVIADGLRAADNVLHERVNRIREELAREFVRRIDLDGHLGRIDKSLIDLREDQKNAQNETHKRLDTLILAMNGNKQS